MLWMTSHVRKTSSLRLHPSSSLVPPMTAHEYANLLTDIREHGIQQPLDIDGSTILDGRHRFTIAQELTFPTVPVRSVSLNGDGAITYMMRMAILRRHLTDDQRAVMLALWKKENSRRGRPRKNSHNGVGISASEIPKVFNLPRRKLDEATYLLTRAPARLEEVHRGTLRLKELLRTVRMEQQLTEIQTLSPPRGHFSVIVIDPPWSYEKRRGDVTKRGIIPYPPMSTSELEALTIPAADDCILWLWTTNAFMHEAYHLLEAWGFEPKTILTWVKDRFGVGDWLRGQTEHCILAIKGKPIVQLTNQSTFLHAQKRGHSKKPDEFFTLVENLCPYTSRLAMFFPTSRTGWKRYGITT